MKISNSDDKFNKLYKQVMKKLEENQNLKVIDNDQIDNVIEKMERMVDDDEPIYEIIYRKILSATTSKGFSIKKINFDISSTLDFLLSRDYLPSFLSLVNSEGDLHIVESVSRKTTKEDEESPYKIIGVSGRNKETKTVVILPRAIISVDSDPSVVSEVIQNDMNEINERLEKEYGEHEYQSKSLAHGLIFYSPKKIYRPNYIYNVGIGDVLGCTYGLAWKQQIMKISDDEIKGLVRTDKKYKLTIIPPKEVTRHLVKVLSKHFNNGKTIRLQTEVSEKMLYKSLDFYRKIVEIDDNIEVEDRKEVKIVPFPTKHFHRVSYTLLALAYEKYSKKRKAPYAVDYYNFMYPHFQVIHAQHYYATDEDKYIILMPGRGIVTKKYIWLNYFVRELDRHIRNTIGDNGSNILGTSYDGRIYFSEKTQKWNKNEAKFSFNIEGESYEFEGKKHKNGFIVTRPTLNRLMTKFVIRSLKD